MSQATESFDTSDAAKTSSGPTFLVAMAQYDPQGQRIIDDDLAEKVLPGGERFFFRLLRIPLLRNWMNNLSEKQIGGASSAFLCRKRTIDGTIIVAVENGSNTAVINRLVPN